jgi:hypothetical protein
MGGSTPVGMFLAVLEAVQGEFRTTKLKAFRVSRGGPYDVRIELMENEVRQGEYLDFIVTVENKGEVSQDVYLEYWVSSGATSYYYAAESVYTPALMNQSFTRGAYIYSNQPLGNYTLNVKATYDYVQPPAPANSSFIVIEGLPSPPTTIIPGPGPSVYPPTGGVVTPTEPVSGILISKYNSNVSLAPGMVKIESVVVENIGGVDLRNITLSLLDIPSDWYNVTPGSYELLPDGNSSVFLITFRIPEDAEFGVHKARLIASSSTQSDQKTMEITIYESLKEVLLKEIEKLKEDLQDIIIETRIAERQGKNVSVIYLMIEEIQAEIGSAEENLEKDDLDEALDNVANAKNLIEQTRVLLGLTGVEVFEFPLWLFFIVSTCVAIALSSLYILKRKKSLGRVLELTHMKRFLAPKIDKDSLIKEKNKLSRVLSVLEREKNEKIISIKAYDEIRKGVEAKLAEIEKKLKKA